MKLEPKVYIADDGEEVDLCKALAIITDEWIDAGKSCDQTVIDLRNAIIKLLPFGKENEQLQERIATLEQQARIDLAMIKSLMKDKDELQQAERKGYELAWVSAKVEYPAEVLPTYSEAIAAQKTEQERKQ